MSELLIHAPPGARSGLLASWLTSNLRKPCYDVGNTLKTNFIKLHNDWNNEQAKKVSYVKIRIRPSFCMLAEHLYLFLTKNVYTQIANFPTDGYGFETVEKLLESAKSWWYHDQHVDNSLYDKVITFKDTYDINVMIDLFSWYNDKIPTAQQIELLKQTNILNQPDIPLNHASSVAAMIVEQEYLQGLKEIDRCWSLRQIYKSTEQQQLYNTVRELIVPDNYGISDFHGVAINDNLLERKNDF